MALGCKSSIGCVDHYRTPVRATFTNLYRPESDAEFVRSVIVGEKNLPKKWASSPRVVDSYSCRQMYLRSYTFSKEVSVPERTRKCFVKVKEKAADFPSFIIRSSSVSSLDDGSVRSKKRDNSKSTGKKKRKSCPTAIRTIFRRLLSCTTNVDVVEHGSLN